MKKPTKITVYSLAAIALFLLGDGAYLLNYALKPSKATPAKEMERLHYGDSLAAQWLDSLQRAGGVRELTLTTASGKQHAYFIAASRPTGKVAVLVHGYKRSAIAMMNLGRMYWQQLGYNVLLPDLYAHGLSEGKSIQMGWFDRYDVERWMQVAAQLCELPGRPAQMVVHGVSMGAATVMYMAGDTLPSYVKCLVEDCGYTSVRDEFAYQLKQQFRLPSFPLIPIASEMCKLRYGWSFQEADAEKTVSRCKLPMLFIHGGNDTFVPTSMVYELYKAKPQPKQLYVSPGSEHARSYNDNPERYTSVVKGFISQYIR